MLPVAVLLALGSLSSVFAKGIPISAIQKQTQFPVKTVPGAFVIELQSISDLPTSRRQLDPHAAFYEALDKRGIVDWSVRREFTSGSLFTGVALQLNNQQGLNNIAQIPGVIAVRPVISIPAPDPVKKVIPSGPKDPQVPPDTESTHVMTGVDKVHALGILGSGIKIGIIDTGTDYTNPVLGGCFGPGCKVAGGFDFVGDNFNGTNTPVPDPDPLDQCNGHGTHVAGIIGANPQNQFNISGVAYESTLFSYRVFGCTGTVPDDVLTEALLRGVSDGMDILTMSLGGSDGWTESTTSVLSSRIAAMGKVVTIAAGNDGQFGAFFTSSPGNGINAISAASVDNIVNVVQSATVSVSHGPIAYFSFAPLPIPGSHPIFATSTDTTVVDDACNPLPAGTPNLAPFVVIIRRGTCTFVQKLQNVAAFGAQFALIYNNGGSFSAIDVGNFTAALIQEADGDFLVQQFIAKSNLTISFPQTGGSITVPNTDTGGLVSTFTSYGPTNDMFFKPAVAAPGGNILSTFPVPLGSFAILSGTSMATPFLAGSSALILQSKGRGVASQVRNLMETTAQFIPSTLTDGDPLQTLAQQGAGLVNTFNAITFQTVVTPGELLLNDTAHFNGVHTITIENTGKTIQTYKLSHVPAGTMVSLVPGSIQPADGPVPLTTAAANVAVFPSTVIVPPGGRATVVATITPPKGVDATTFPVFSGFIQIKSQQSGENLHVSYLGVAAALKNQQVVDNTDAFFGVVTPVILDSLGDIQTAPQNYSFVGADAPTLLFRQTAGSPALKIDLVQPNIKVATNLERSIFSFWWPGVFKPKGTFSEVKTIGPIAEFDFIPRNNDDPMQGFNTLTISPAVFANNTVIPNGQYRILLRVLKITGDPTNEADYEAFLSPIIGVEQP